MARKILTGAKADAKFIRRLFRRCIDLTEAEKNEAHVELLCNINLLAQIRQETQAEREQLWMAEDYSNKGMRAYLENSPETYGQSVAEQQKHYGGNYCLHSANGVSADVEVSETDKAIIQSCGHAGDVEKPLA